MLRRVVLGLLLVGLITILATGAIVRTIDKTDNVAEAQGAGHGHQRNAASGDMGARGGQGYGRQSRSGGNEQGQGAALGLDHGQGTQIQGEGLDVVGTVVQSPAAGAELVIRTDDGAEITVGTGPGYMEAQGFTLQPGERVQVSGYQDGDELKATQVTRLRDGASLTLRDQTGRPAWAGQGRRAAGQEAAPAAEANGQASRNQGRSGQGGQADPGESGSPSSALTQGLGKAQVDEWLTLEGTVVSVGPDALTVEAADGGQIVLENRAWWFAQEQGFVAQAGDEVLLRGFYEGKEFEVGEISIASSGQNAVIREENGRPMWAGRGRRSS